MAEQLGRYEILEIIGEGGFAIVYRGRDLALDRPVALKELRPTLLLDRAWVQRFQREARTIARLDHPSIVPIYDVYEANNRLFIVMRLVDNVSLNALIERSGKLDWADVLQVMVPILHGLNYAHKNGVLHRDLKPANILIDMERGPMLSDFGLAKMVGEHSISMTESGSIIGTPHYIAPEVWEGKGADKRADIYAMGCILYEMIIGEKMFKGDTPPAVMMAHFKPLSLPARWPDNVPVGVSAVLTRSLAQDPDERYPTAAKMADALTVLSPGLFSPPTTSFSADQIRSSDLTSALGDGQNTDAIPQASAGPHSEPPSADPTSSEREPSSSPVKTPDFEKPSHGKQVESRHQRRGGCFRVGTFVGLFVLAAMLLIVVGLGSFCAAAGGSLGSNIGAPFESVVSLLSQNIEVGETVTDNISIPLPEDVPGPYRLDIEVAASKFRLQSGATDALLEGTATYNVDILKPKIVSNGQNIRLMSEGTDSELLLLMASDFVRSDITNEWDLRLGDAPMALGLDTGTAEASIAFGPVAITDLTYNHSGANSVDLTFSEPNSVEMNTFDFRSLPARRVTMTGLANTRAENLRWDVAGGEYTLVFDGQLTEDMAAELSGVNGNFTLIIPENVAAEVVVESSGITTDAAGEWVQEDELSYLLPNIGSLISIKVGLESGTVKLRTR
jgi:serine/threonine-protein kinase